MSVTINPHHNVNASISGYAYTSGGLGGVNSTITTSTWSAPNHNPSVILEQSGVVQLEGEKADVIINGISLTETLKVLQDRLNILRPNIELEAEWDELHELGKQYRKKEAEFLEKKRAWDILKRQE